jgi:hypothetical protein
VSDRGKYEVMVRVLTQRTVIVDADGFDEAEELAMQEVQALTGGYEPEVLWAMEVEVKDD